MKTVAAGAHYTTVTVDTEEEVKFSFASTSLSVEAAGGDITVALRQGAQAGDDETITVPDGETKMFIHHRMNVDTYYLTGSGTATLYASNMGDVNPFKAGKRGGDGGGDNTHYKGTTTTPLENGSTTNPIVIDGESYTAVFGDVVVYGYTEFIFDGTQWSEFGRPFDTVPTQGSTNAVTSDGIYNRTPFIRAGWNGTGAVLGNSTANGGNAVAVGSFSQANGGDSLAAGYSAYSTGAYSSALGFNVSAKGYASHVVGKNNNYGNNDLFEIGNGTNPTHLSNLVEANNSRFNVNCALQINNVPIPTPYTTMPTITADMLGKIAMYVGTSDSNYKQGCFYIASTDGAAEPTYSWVKIGGGRTETILWENEGTTNPDTITLSEAWSDFDELVIVTAYIGSGIIQKYENIRHTSIIEVGGSQVFWYNSEATWGAYSATSSTVFTKISSGGDYHIQKIIGIKY